MTRMIPKIRDKIDHLLNASSFPQKQVEIVVLTSTYSFPNYALTG